MRFMHDAVSKNYSFDNMEELEIGKVYRLTADDIYDLIQYCENYYVSIDFVENSNGAGMGTYSNFLYQYPFIAIECKVLACEVDENDELAVPHYKLKFIKAEAIANFWSENENALVWLKEDVFEAFGKVANIQINCGKTKGDISNFIIEA